MTATKIDTTAHSHRLLEIASAIMDCEDEKMARSTKAQVPETVLNHISSMTREALNTVKGLMDRVESMNGFEYREVLDAYVLVATNVYLQYRMDVNDYTCDCIDKVRRGEM